ncbi:arginine--tRNA ligase [Candidatus Marsarchaeota archaeon]|nr:arginine--tRNA ligase [Candidatus Marsarchaeota archaeon]
MESPYSNLKKRIVKEMGRIAKELGESYSDTDLANSIGLSKGDGDLSCSIAFRLAAKLKIPAEEAAKKIASKIGTLEHVEKIAAESGFINFYLERSSFTEKVLNYAFDVQPGKPVSNMGNGDKVIVEYPSANPAHPLHVGQVRSALLGDSVSNLHQACGYKVEREDYIDDLGLQAAHALWGSMNRDKLGLQFDPKKKFDHTLGETYVAAYKYIEEHKLDDEIRELMQLMDQDGTYESELSRKQAEEYVRAERETTFAYCIYHDLLVWESDLVHDKILERGLNILEEHGMLDRPKEGKYANCTIIDLKKMRELPKEFKGLREEAKVLIRSDGTPNYLAKDIAFHMWKFGILKNTFKFSKLIEMQPDGKPLYTTSREGKDMDFGSAKKVVNTIDSRQTAEQSMIRVIFQAMGENDAAMGFNHLSYGTVELESGALAGRKGTWLGYTADDMLREAMEKAIGLIGEKFRLQEKEREETARGVALGAIRFEFLRFSPEKKIMFSWDKALNFQGDSGPYCQYMYARALRLLEDSGIKKTKFDAKYIGSDAEFGLAKRIARLTDMAEKACSELRPNILTEYCLDLSFAFSNFYEQCPILKAKEEGQKQSRLALTLAFANALKYAVGLLGVPLVNRM